MNEATRSPAPPRILVVDDQPDVREAMRLLLKSAGYGMVGAESPEIALGCLRGDAFAAVLVDMNYTRDTTSGEEGLTLIAHIAAQWPGLPVIAMTAWASVGLAVTAMQQGAVDFVEKPWQNARVLSVLESRIALDRSRRSERRLSDAQALQLQDAAGGFIAESAVMRRLLEDLMRIADSDVGVLLLGENGTGKSLVAQLLHQWSARRTQPLIKVNIGGLAATLFESELFGHVRGAFTDARQDRSGRFELADGGTLFLDEIGNLPLEQQAKLLRAIEDGEFERVGSSRTQRVDVRIVAATNADLDAEVAAGRFRQDLLYRLNTFQLRVPPLRERRDDILPLARHYLAAACTRYRRTLPTLARDAEHALLGYPWPGNVRELAHTMERAALLVEGAVLGADALRLRAPSANDAVLPERMTLEQAEALLLRRALAEQEGNLQRTADQLGITRQSLYRRLGKHGLRSDDAD
ncbi:sigma-54-dependent transcriptional regulator [Xanthomonas hortorum]|uniref:C4-dicarboxylate transport transcriptional regulatory protein DctD n=1 Tax=Xanthomonas hortorum pv. carotae TaxID=487904 RepID=A0A6V7FBH4_9XANT|nr:sigma-54 dependent transcriptional regulator [Xanthomonas hortorum]CAD0360719.1 C4-dicarboxylate transport transcriptional regulatory protein DctD [Xanthomonas hortorum pv. carotae]CAD0360721.1 C4-dicarboxylate transport transcriptional regulatory protein DctD [Xanthomonas hortorum pv. carotae]